MVIAAGGGSFQPKSPPIPGIDPYENGTGVGVYYAVRKMEPFRGKHIVIIGGGDSALDWTLNLQPMAERVTLIHRRDGFRAAPPLASRRCSALARPARWTSCSARSTELKGGDGVLDEVLIDRQRRRHGVDQADAFLPFFGLTMKLGPVAELGLNLHENLIPVDTEKFESPRPGSSPSATSTTIRAS